MRVLNIAVLGMAAISIAVAGQIEIGANNSGGVSTSGLTAAYVALATQTGNAWAGERGPYEITLFSGSTITGSSLGGSTTPEYQNGYQQFTDVNNANGNVTFAMLDDGANGNNLWASSSGQMTGPTTITLPVNVLGATSAYILLNDYFADNSSQTDTVTFNFNGGAITDVFTLTNGNQIDSSTACRSASPTWTGAGNCATEATSFTSAGTDNAWTASYSNTSVNAVVYSGTTGTLSLADLTFNLSGYSGDVLTSIAITDNNNGPNISKLALSAITVSGANAVLVTPEPSTVFLLFAGLGVMVFLGLRRKVQQ